MSQAIELRGVFADHHYGMRLDQALSDMFPDYSRTRIKEWILQGAVTVDGQPAPLPRERVMAGQAVLIATAIEEDTRWQAQDIELEYCLRR